MSVHTDVKKVTTHTLQRMKQTGEKISMITAYDYSFARIFDAAGIDVILVGGLATPEPGELEPTPSSDRSTVTGCASSTCQH